MKLVRAVLIFLVGGALTYLTFLSQFRSSFLDALIWILLIFIGIPVFTWTILKDLDDYNKEKQIKNLSLTFISISFIVSILALEVKIQRNLDKPTLIKVFHDGDFNGIGIDFKKDGSYILNNSSIGFSDYFYGNFKIQGDKISMDREQIENIKNLQYLGIFNIEIEYQDGIKSEPYLFMIDKNGKKIDEPFKFRVVIDNRNKTKL